MVHRIFEGVLKQPATAQETQVCLTYALRQILLLAHPFIPFITEQILKSAPKLSSHDISTLMLGPYPASSLTTDAPAKRFQDSEAQGVVGLWKDAIDRLRTFRGENNISPKAAPQVTYDMIDPSAADSMKAGISMIASLAHLGSLQLETGALRDKLDTGEIITQSVKFYLPLQGLVDFAEEEKRLKKEKETLLNGISHLEKILQKPDFTARAPQELVAAEKARLEKMKNDVASVERSLSRLTQILGKG